MFYVISLLHQPWLDPDRGWRNKTGSEFSEWSARAQTHSGPLIAAAMLWPLSQPTRPPALQDQTAEHVYSSGQSGFILALCGSGQFHFPHWKPPILVEGRTRDFPAQAFRLPSDAQRGRPIF